MSTEILNLKLKLVTLPESPGVYQFFDNTGKIIYVGKAKNIKKRVSSYFNKTLDNNKTRILVRQIFEIKYIVVETELDALLLENNLIKTYQPKYNIQLKDDKTFPWIVVKKEVFPRIFSTRQKLDDGSIYYGPYPNVQVMNALLHLIREMYPLRTCSLDLSQQKIKAKKFSVCLEYHLKRCLGPCEGKQEKEAYDKMIEEIHLLLKGKKAALEPNVKSRMQMLSNNYVFEDAQEMKLLLGKIEKYKSKSTIVSPTISDLDVFTCIEEETCFFFNYLVVREGAIIHAYTNQIIKKLKLLQVEKTIQEVDRGKYIITPSQNYYTGRVDMAGRGQGYIIVEDLEEDIYVKSKNLNKSLNGDIVEVYVFKRRKGGKTEGEVTKIIERKKTEFVGTIDITDRFAFVNVAATPVTSKL